MGKSYLMGAKNLYSGTLEKMSLFLGEMVGLAQVTRTSRSPVLKTFRELKIVDLLVDSFAIRCGILIL
jgi:hypothetical protein